MRVASGSLEHPLTKLKWWSVTYVLIMSARNFSHPVTVVVAVKTPDHSLHVVRLP